MSKNLLTEDLILEGLTDRGVHEPGSLDTEDAMKIVLKHFGATLKSGWESYCDVYYYTENTADGYEVWIRTHDENKVNVSEDVYYYDNDWLEDLAEHIRDGYTIHIDEAYYGDYIFAEVIEELYEDYFNDMKEEVENELIDKGYEWEE